MGTFIRHQRVRPQKVVKNVFKPESYTRGFMVYVNTRKMLIFKKQDCYGYEYSEHDIAPMVGAL